MTTATDTATDTASAALPKQYEPAAVQPKWLDRWRRAGVFNADAGEAEPYGQRRPHTIMIPLPNVTGALHMGHALNGTLQDIITRYRRQRGCEALWMPGTDHAGIATQSVVERRMLEEEGLSRHDVGREALVNRIWAWKESYERRILDQLAGMGASCDWRRTRFTLDDVCTRAVRRTFFSMFRDGLIYRGQRLVNWDSYLQTAVADDEVYYEDTDGQFWTFTYPVVDDAGQPTDEVITFSTTRPETMLGDTAVCVHPSDARYADLIGRQVLLPLSDRTVPIIADALLADPTKGTGAVKVTPAHDPNDYACGLRNDLPMIGILNGDGTINAEGGRFAGLDRLDARPKVVEAMEQAGHYVGVEPRTIPTPFSDRSKTPIEPLLSDQWFVRMADADDGSAGLAQQAIDAVEDNRVRFYPARYRQTYVNWLAEKRDWCISRQLWWGHRIPVWTRTVGESKTDEATAEVEALGGGEAIAQSIELSDGELRQFVCVDADHPALEERLEAAGFDRDPDVLDTWFSSALWPHATLGWPDCESNPPLHEEVVAEQTDAVAPPPTPDGENGVLKAFYPGSVLITSRDIITLWVARMVMMGQYNCGDVPFAHVHIHPKILDGRGQTMSKTKGNGVDPLDLIDKYGTDALRFTLSSLAGETQDVKLPVSYECPHCGEYIEQSNTHLDRINSGEPPRLTCPKCKTESWFASPYHQPPEGEPVAKSVSERFEYGRNFGNKLWNAARFAFLNLEGYQPGVLPPLTERPIEDRWIVSRLHTVIGEVTDALDRYQFDVATRSLRDFVWNEFCDWYVEMLKVRLRDEGLRPAAQRMLAGVLDAILRLLQPFVPFVTAELWETLNELAPARGFVAEGPCETLCIEAAWPTADASQTDPALESRFNRLQEIIIAVRNVRATYKIPPGERVPLLLRSTADVAAEMQDVQPQFDQLARVVLEAAGAEIERPPASASFSLDDADGFIPLEGLVDRDQELARQQKEADKIRGHITGAEKKLANEKFTANAPPQVVADVRSTLESLQKQLESVEQIMADLQ